MKTLSRLGVAAIAIALSAGCATQAGTGPTAGMAAGGDPAALTSEKRAARYKVLTDLEGCGGCGEFATFTQGGWGSVPKGGNPGGILATNFASIAPLIVGINNTLRFDSALEVQNFLPTVGDGTPAALTQSYDPPVAASGLGVFSAQVTALKLNVLLDDAIRPNPDGELSGVVIIGGPFNGYTVGQLLFLAERVLGGDLGALPGTTTISDLSDAVAAVNEGFNAGNAGAPNNTTFQCPPQNGTAN